MTVLSTGMGLGKCCATPGCEGVCMPGVEGGVKAGDTRPGSADSCSESDGVSVRVSFEGFAECEMFKEVKSSSEIARDTGIGRGE